MTCNSCGNQEAYHVRSVYEKGEIYDTCNQCSGISLATAYSPDVYLHRAGQTFENLCDPNGKPYEIQSKRHKKQVMDQLGVSEAGGTINGARFGTKSWIDGSRDARRREFAKDRPMIQKTIREWKERARAGR